MKTAGILHLDADRLEWPEVRLVAPRRYELAADYRIEWEVAHFPRQRLIVPSRFVCDGASVPSALEWYLGREKILPAAVAHDWQYAFAGRIPDESHLYQDPADGLWKPAGFLWSRQECDRFFARNLRFCGIRNDQRRNAYRAVRLFGGVHWARAARRMARDPVAATQT
jgi:hypothetical protein